MSDPSAADGDNDGTQTATQKSSSSKTNLGRKVKTLTASIATLTMEKSRLETAFQEDRKKLVQVREKLLISHIN